MKQIELTPEECAAVSRVCGLGIVEIKSELESNITGAAGVADLASRMNENLKKDREGMSEQERKVALERDENQIIAYHRSKAEKEIGILDSVMKKVLVN